MEIDDSIGMSGENVKSLPEDITNALRLAYQRYTTYLDAFGPEEVYSKKKVETELGTKMIHLKMRCSGLGSEWGKVTGTWNIRTLGVLRGAKGLKRTEKILNDMFVICVIVFLTHNNKIKGTGATLFGFLHHQDSAGDLGSGGSNTAFLPNPNGHHWQ
ncbi:hypothetical protein Rs2_38790 [Raphanus sativus]|nr:hypothetical protein Rs2_38790 [Raphanus sativus]